MIQPKISIITVTYNSEKTLEETILSVINQRYENLEYIIIDGGSKDHTLDIVNKYIESIAYFVSEPDKGISDAFNKGIAAATGDIIGIINSDDLLLPDALETIAEAYEPQIDVYRGIMQYRNASSNTNILIKPIMRWDLGRESAGSVNHPSTFIRKGTYNKWGVYDVQMKYNMDMDIFYRFYNRGAVFKYVDQPLAVFNVGGVTDTVAWTKKLRERNYMILKNGGSKTLAFCINTKWIIKQILHSIIVKLILYEVFIRLKHEQ